MKEDYYFDKHIVQERNITHNERFHTNLALVDIRVAIEKLTKTLNEVKNNDK